MGPAYGPGSYGGGGMGAPQPMLMPRGGPMGQPTMAQPEPGPGSWSGGAPGTAPGSSGGAWAGFPQKMIGEKPNVAPPMASRGVLPMPQPIVAPPMASRGVLPMPGRGVPMGGGMGADQPQLMPMPMPMPGGPMASVGAPLQQQRPPWSYGRDGYRGSRR